MNFDFISITILLFQERAMILLRLYNKLDLVLMFYRGVGLYFYIKKYLNIEIGLKKMIVINILQ
jgi:hypothetical protein